MEDNNILSAEGALLERINEYQRRIADLSINILGITVLPNEQQVYHYKIINSTFKSWVLDLGAVIKPEQKKNITLLSTMVANACELPMFSDKTIHTISGSSLSRKKNGENIELLKKVFYALENELKEQTNRFFSTSKQSERLIK